MLRLILVLMRFGVGALPADVCRHLLNPLPREGGSEGQDAQSIFNNGLRRLLQESPASLTRAGCHKVDKPLIEDYRLYMLLDLGYKVSSVTSNLRRLHQAFRRAMSSACFGSISTGTRTASNYGGSSEHMHA